MLDIFSNKLEPVNFEQESEIIKSQIAELLSDIDSKLRYRRKQPTRSDIEKLEERYKKIKEKLKKIEENFKKELSKLKLDKSNLNGKNFQQNTEVQAFSNNSSSATKITKMNNIINKFTDNKRKFLIELITKNKAFSEIQKIYTNTNVNKINNKRLENATKSKNIPKNSGELFKSIIKLHKLLNSLERPNSSIALRKILLNVTVKYVTDKLKLINEKKNFLLPSNGSENVSNQVSEFNKLKNRASTSSSSPNQPPKPKPLSVNAATEPEPNGSPIDTVEPRRSGRVTKRPTQPEGMLTGSNATAALNRANRNAEENKRRRAAIEQSKSQSALEVLSNATGKLERLGNRVKGSEQGPLPPK